jgi:hypothetical protein
MKRTFILYLALIVSQASFAQTDTTKVEQYCQVIASPKLPEQHK